MGRMAVTWTNALLAAGSALAGALAVVVLTHLVVRLLARRWSPASRLAHSARRPFRALVVLLALSGWVAGVRPDPSSDWATWWDAAALALRVLAIGAGGWLLTAVLLFVEDLTLGRTRTDVRDNRLTIALVTIVTIGAILFSFPAVRTIGASVLASAGLISVVAALAAQSMLANVFAGMQLAFNDAVKVDDAVIVEGEWGTIEEITLSYVVVRIWDERRMILPSTYFTTTPFQNWTRKNSELMGSVELDLDWRTGVDALREHLPSVMERAGEMWDGRVSHVQVTDAVGGWVRVRVLVTSYDAPTLYDLRCHVREELVRWVREHHTEALPVQRLLLDGQ